LEDKALLNSEFFRPSSANCVPKVGGVLYVEIVVHYQWSCMDVLPSVIDSMDCASALLISFIKYIFCCETDAGALP
jgi:hypothetical protein